MRTTIRTILLTAFWIVLASALNSEASTLCVDAATSQFKIRVGSAGLFSAFGHEHLIQVQGIKGCAEIEWTQLERSSVSLTFAAKDIRVLDPDHPNDKAKVQETMETEVLRTKEFPEIQFKSSRVRETPSKTSSGDRHELMVEGSLTIRGRTQNVSLPLVIQKSSSNGAKVTGRYVLKQSAFGITPVKVMGGTVRVKDEITIEFELQLKEQ